LRAPTIASVLLVSCFITTLTPCAPKGAFASPDSYKQYYYEVSGVMGAVMEIPADWRHLTLESKPPTGYMVLSIRKPGETSQIDLDHFPLLPGMTPYDSVQEFAVSVKKEYLKYPRRLISETLRRIGDYEFYEMVIEMPPGKGVFLLLKEERGCWAFELLMYDPKSEVVDRPILERIVSSFRPAFKTTLESNWPASLIIDGKEQNAPTTLYLSPFKYHELEAPQSLPKDEKTRLAFEKWSVGTKTEYDRKIKIYTSDSFVVKVSYKREFRLDVFSEYGTIEGAGWYSEGSDAKVSLRPILAMALVYPRFSHWEGDFFGSDPIIMVKMDAPKTIRAIWKTDYTNIYIALAVLAIVIGLLAFRFGRKRKPTPELMKKEPSDLAHPQRRCVSCGITLEAGEDFCPNCGKKRDSFE